MKVEKNYRIMVSNGLCCTFPQYIILVPDPVVCLYWPQSLCLPPSHVQLCCLDVLSNISKSQPPVCNTLFTTFPGPQPPTYTLFAQELQTKYMLPTCCQYTTYMLFRWNMCMLFNPIACPLLILSRLQYYLCIPIFNLCTASRSLFACAYINHLPTHCL